MNRRVVLVTGSSKGIGASTILRFAANNYDVVINYNSDLEGAVELKTLILQKYDVRCLIIQSDVSNELSVKLMIDTIIQEFGHLDVVVNNAGIAIDTMFDDKSVDNFKKILDTNLIGTFLVSKYAAKYMLEANYGKIINVSSTNAIDTFYPMSIDYDASKAGVISLTHNLALQFSPIINVNCVAPGWVNTDMNKELDNAFIEEENKKIFLKRFAEPDEIASVIYFLASDDAKYINGEVIRVDGGH